MNLTEILSAVRTAFAEPVIVRPDPSGDGEIHYTRCGSGGYEPEFRSGPRVKARNHVFTTPGAIASFLRSTERYAEPAYVDVLVGDQGISAVPDPEEPGSDRLTCPYRPHPEFAHWLLALDAQVPITQRALIQHLRAARGSLGEEQASQWLTALGILKVASRGALESQVDELGYTKLRGGEQSREVSTRIPPVMNVLTPLFEGIVDEQGVELLYDLEILVEFDAEELVFRLTCPLLPIVRAKAVQDVAELLTRLLGEDFLVVRGEANWRDVPAVPLTSATPPSVEA